MEVKLLYKYLTHDIDQKIWRAANMRIDDAEKRLLALSHADDKDYYRREIEAAVASMLAPLYGLHAEFITESDDILDTSKSSWTITLSDNLKCSARVVAELMHKFVVNSVMAGWAVLYSPAEAAVFTNNSLSILQRLEELLFELSLPQKHKGHKCSNSIVVDNSFIVNTPSGDNVIPEGWITISPDSNTEPLEPKPGTDIDVSDVSSFEKLDP